MGKELRHGVESVFCFAPEAASRTTRRPAKLQRAHQYKPSKLRAKRRAAESRRTDWDDPIAAKAALMGFPVPPAKPAATTARHASEGRRAAKPAKNWGMALTGY